MNDEPEQKEPTEQLVDSTGDLPSGIARLRAEWEKLGFGKQSAEKPRVGIEPIIFPEPVGDYKVPMEEARAKLGLSEEAMNRLLDGGGVDSILVRFGDEVVRMVSQSALERFMEDSGMDTSRSDSVFVPVSEIAAALETIRAEMAELRDIQSRQLQQFKDILLLELRNLKEQDRDLTSFIYDLTSALEELFPKLKKRKRSSPPEESQ